MIHETSTNPDAQPYKYSGKEFDRMHGLDWSDFGARWLMGSVPVWSTPDPLAEKYYSISPYAYCAGNPVNAIDPDGKDSYLIIWATANGNIGHAGFAVDNYVQQNVLDQNGNAILDANGNFVTEMVADGTVTYYDLWPGGEGVGKKNAGKNVEASYSIIENTTLDAILHTDVTGSEGYSPDGVVRISSDAETDMKTKIAITDFMQTPIYNGRTRNCSDLSEVGVNSSLGITINANEFIPFKSSTTPNKLYRETIKQQGTSVLKNPEEKVKRSFLRGVLGF